MKNVINGKKNPNIKNCKLLNFLFFEKFSIIIKKRIIIADSKIVSLIKIAIAKKKPEKNKSIFLSSKIKYKLKISGKYAK
jgi:hypothetical protein